MGILNIKSKYLLIFLILMSCTIFSQEQNYIPYRKGKVWGLCDINKFIVVQPQYSSISSYDESVGGFHAEQNGQFGIIDRRAVMIMPFISHMPISVDGDKYLVFDGWDYYYYSIKTKMRLEKYIKRENYPIRDRGWENDPLYRNDAKLTLNRNDLDDEDLDMLVPYDDDNYQLNYKSDFIEINKDDTYVGIYIPKLKKIFINTREIAYVGWQFYRGKPYIFTTNDSGLFGLADEHFREVYPIRYKMINLVEASQLVVLSEPDPNNNKNLIFMTILPNNKVLYGKFEPAVTLWKNGNPFQIYYTVIDGQKNYAGEDGTLYFEG
ncbi:hypothetical protein J2795_000666 [Chryseobacterium bernardetii]|uniref:WG repeat protein n=2 Tax=Chryseobacterium TaxID=59732 RepID=A0A543EMB8_9FLAO|nr:MULTISPECIES: hypothetical protein [Chryseobacterium]MDR6369096.1 hypothetical protein [Chryseobacterium vietnamense]MDR6439981.1 hypothetical protein [Chryseobacterium bernardetii]TQM22702.1 hypothetical protein FB551_2421 [Chryseobacterium aquifrigidense]